MKISPEKYQNTRRRRRMCRMREVHKADPLFRMRRKKAIQLNQRRTYNMQVKQDTKQSYFQERERRTRRERDRKSKLDWNEFQLLLSRVSNSIAVESCIIETLNRLDSIVLMVVKVFFNRPNMSTSRATPSSRCLRVQLFILSSVRRYNYWQLCLTECNENKTTTGNVWLTNNVCINSCHWNNLHKRVSVYLIKWCDLSKTLNWTV